MICSDKFYQDYSAATAQKKHLFVPKKEKYDTILSFLKDPSPTNRDDWEKRYWKSR